VNTLNPKVFDADMCVAFRSVVRVCGVGAHCAAESGAGVVDQRPALVERGDLGVGVAEFGEDFFIVSR
jgi:hypothetical protein